MIKLIFFSCSPPSSSPMTRRRECALVWNAHLLEFHRSSWKSATFLCGSPCCTAWLFSTRLCRYAPVSHTHIHLTATVTESCPLLLIPPVNFHQLVNSGAHYCFLPTVGKTQIWASGMEHTVRVQLRWFHCKCGVCREALGRLWPQKGGNWATAVQASQIRNVL